MLPHLQVRYTPPSTLPSEPPFQPDVDRLPRPLLRHDHPASFYFPDIDHPPPHLYSNYTVRPGPLTSPRFLRFTSTHIGTDRDTQQATGLPIACIWQPLADVPIDETVPLLDSPDIARCESCQAFTNPFCEVLAAGHRFKCNMCGTEQRTSENALRRKGPFTERECGLYDIPVPVDMSQSSRTVFAICVDVSLIGANFGLYRTVYGSIKDALEFLPSPASTSFLLLSFDSQLCCYLNSPQVQSVLVTDQNDLFIPVPLSDLLFPASDPGLGERLAFLMEAPRAEMTGNALAVGDIVAALKEVLPQGSRVMVVVSNIGSAGRWGVEAETGSSWKAPQIDLVPLATDTARAGITVDLFVCSGKYMDLVSLSALTSLTGGEIHHFPGFLPARDNAPLCYQLIRTVTRPQVSHFHAKVRTSDGLNLIEALGHTLRKSPTEFTVPLLDCDQAVALLFEHDSSLKNGSLQFVQLTCSFTDDRGRAFVRVCNGALRATWSYAEVVRNCDVETLMCVEVKRRAQRVRSGRQVEKEREDWTMQLARALHSYREIMGDSGNSGQLVLPESLRNWPIYTLSALRLAAFTSTDSDRSTACLHRLTSLGLKDTYLMLYPRCYRIDTILKQLQEPGSSDNPGGLPDLVPAASRTFLEEGAYLMDNGDILGLQIGPKVATSFLQATLGVNTFDELKQFDLHSVLPRQNNELNARLQRVIGTILTKNNGKYQALRLLLDPGALQLFTVEDRTCSSPSYSEFLLSVHRRVLALIGF